MLADSFFSLPAPKSTGREYFNDSWLEKYLVDFCQRYGHSLEGLERNAESVQATLLELSAQSIAEQIQSCVAGRASLPVDLIVCGGGAYNLFLIERLQALCDYATVQTSEDYGILPEAIEAAAFAFFAQQTWRGNTANIPSVTGASRSCLLGNIVLP
jgi:anhydro-N-acetylmuramic acid kinase